DRSLVTEFVNRIPGIQRGTRINQGRFQVRHNIRPITHCRIAGKCQIRESGKGKSKIFQVSKPFATPNNHPAVDNMDKVVAEGSIAEALWLVDMKRNTRRTIHQNIVLEEINTNAP